MNSNYPKTAEEWWELLDRNWKDIKEIVLRFYPCQEKFPETGHIRNLPDAPMAQVACNVIIKKMRIKKPIWKNIAEFSEYLETLKTQRDKSLSEIIESSWFGIPETHESRYLPGFYAFCDLCSEAYVLYE